MKVLNKLQQTYLLNVIFESNFLLLKLALKITTSKAKQRKESFLVQIVRQSLNRKNNLRAKKLKIHGLDQATAREPQEEVRKSSETANVRMLLAATQSRREVGRPVVLQGATLWGWPHI